MIKIRNYLEAVGLSLIALTSVSCESGPGMGKMIHELFDGKEERNIDEYRLRYNPNYQAPVAPTPTGGAEGEFKGVGYDVAGLRLEKIWLKEI